ncbi:MAG: bifunctional enoyl-CoA hydratase/phosphate acetyltransferase [Dethiosulfovibrio sp.]|nr:bifunctional enoyl-CoA hydratase/phosphate acetyltransferase [Dethiosulfovibrio sp.]
MKSLDFLMDKSVEKGLKRIAVTCPYEEDTLGAVCEAHKRGIVEGILVGKVDRIEKKAHEMGVSLEGMSLVDEKDDYSATDRTVKMVSSGEADLLMKGLVKTAILLKAVLNKEWGLRSGSLLSHLVLVEIGPLGRVLGVTDGGMNMYPDLNAKAQILQNAVDCYHSLGIDFPKVAVLAAVEAVNPDMSATLDGAALTQMAARGQITGCLVDGPLALDNAVSQEAADIKGIDSPVAGKADILLVPDIEAGNMVGKTAMFLAGCRTAGVILGAKKPIVMTSRFDSMDTKLLSIALGAAVS